MTYNVFGGTLNPTHFTPPFTLPGVYLDSLTSGGVVAMSGEGAFCGMWNAERGRL